jgi:hypothetical protein
MGSNQILKISDIKRNSYQNQETTHRKSLPAVQQIKELISRVYKELKKKT